MGGKLGCGWHCKRKRALPTAWKVNWGPQSEEMLRGTTNQVTQFWMKVWLQDSVVLEAKGMASGQSIVQSTQVRR